MGISQQIEAVYRRALLLRQYALKSPAQENLLEKALQELYFVLEELQSSQEELHQQNRELMATRESVELERQRYQSLFELAPNRYLVTDLQGNICQANQYAADRLFCTSQDYLINKPLLVFIHESDRQRFQARLAYPRSGENWEVTLTPPSGGAMAVAIAVTLVNDTHRHGGMLLWSLNDITLRRRLEQQLQDHYQMLETRVTESIMDLVQRNLQLQQALNEYQHPE
ncbi:MAG: PAS domain S-box protein [Oscillatoriales cyanobacterium RM2_1_1]|nr:PAS domain S-box protein [Oscillatoriales cyanobacterium SM2_3_0]NJO46468.1 PAS domain S-box protein [Oscillatoriales cyanobacterium RM2_1_1]